MPSHWKVSPCRTIVRERSERNEGAACQDYLSLLANVGVIPYEEKGDLGNKKPEDLSKCKLVRAGDLVINSMNYGIGSYGLSSYSGVCSPVYIVLEPATQIVEPRFAFRIFENREFQTFAQSFGNGILEHRCAINWDILKGLGVPVPPRAEQLAILSFLDRETARIDALVAEQQRLMELLQEKRQAVISRAVTKGLNPDAPMKPSGVEWLGEIPAHWAVKALKHVAEVDNSGSYGAEPASENIALPVATTAQIDAFGRFAVERMPVRGFTEAQAQRYACGPDDILVVKSSGSAENIISGKAGMVGVSTERFVFSNFLLRIRVDRSVVHPGFVFALVRSNLTRQRIELMCSSTTYPNLKIGQYISAYLPMPPLDEQRNITEYLDGATAKIDALIGEQQRLVDLLKERRTSLISAAVTGQIDVRNLAASAA